MRTSLISSGPRAYGCVYVGVYIRACLPCIYCLLSPSLSRLLSLYLPLYLSSLSLSVAPRAIVCDRGLSYYRKLPELRVNSARSQVCKFEIKER